MWPNSYNPQSIYINSIHVKVEQKNIPKSVVQCNSYWNMLHPEEETKKCLRAIFHDLEINTSAIIN